MKKFVPIFLVILLVSAIFCSSALANNAYSTVNTTGSNNLTGNMWFYSRRDAQTYDFMVLNVLNGGTPSSGNYVTTYPWSGNVGSDTQVWGSYGFVGTGGYVGTYIYPIGNPSVGLNYSRIGGLNPYVTVATVVGNYSADIAVEYHPFNDKFEIEGYQAQNYNKWILEDNLIGTAAAQSGKYCVWARYSSTLFHHIVA